MGAFSSLSAVDLGVVAVSGVLERVGLDPTSGLVDEVIMGQVLRPVQDKTCTAGRFGRVCRSARLR